MASSRAAAPPGALEGAATSSLEQIEIRNQNPKPLKTKPQAVYTALREAEYRSTAPIAYWNLPPARWLVPRQRRVTEALKVCACVRVRRSGALSTSREGGGRRVHKHTHPAGEILARIKAACGLDEEARKN